MKAEKEVAPFLVADASYAVVAYREAAPTREGAYRAVAAYRAAEGSDT